MKGVRLTGLLLLTAVVVAIMAACASMGRPEGGPRDELPPVFVRSNPMPNSLNVTNNRMDIYFNENVQVKDVMNKVVVSPVQVQMPAVSASGKRVTIELRDTLIPNTTYTFDFSDAISDLNEGNILDGFATAFSTGDIIDTLSISGMVLDARTLEPAQGMLVGVYSNLSDTAITKLPFERIAKTNQSGQFTVRNLAPGAYRLFALNDMNRDYKFDRTEDVAFYDSIIVPEVNPMAVNDTLRASDGRDSIVVRQGYKYLPDDILLTWFNEKYQSQYLRNSVRPDSVRLTVEFGAPSDTVPTVTLANTTFAGDNLLEHALLNRSSLRDTLTYWLRTPELISADTLLLSMNYLRTDTLNQLSWTTDTLRFVKPRPAAPKNDKKKEQREMTPQDSINATLTFLAVSAGTTTQELNLPLRFTFSEPLDSIDRSGLHLELLRDTVWTAVEMPELQRDSINRLLEYSAHVRWEPGAKYRFKADSIAFNSIYGHFNRPFNKEFTVKGEEDYSTISLKLNGAPDSIPMMVELLSTNDSPLKKSAVDPNSTAIFEFVPAGTYYARAYADRNGNETWDTGNIAERLQPEETWYYPQKIIVKSNWDISNDWNLNDLPLDAQKPYEIKKNKPKTRDGQPERQMDEDEDFDDFFNPENPFDNKRNTRNNGNSRNGGYSNPANNRITGIQSY